MDQPIKSDDQNIQNKETETPTVVPQELNSQNTEIDLKTETPNVKKPARLIAGFILLLLVSLSVFLFYKYFPGKISPVPSGKPQPNFSFSMEKFTSDTEFRNYIQTSQENLSGISMGNIGSQVDLQAPVTQEGVSLKQMPGGSEPTRVSETNVQVKGIDEPDTVKTDGKNLYISKKLLYQIARPEILTQPLDINMEAPSKITAFPVMDNFTNIVSAFPPQTLAKISKIDKVGNLLLNDGKLVIFSENDVLAYDITDPKNPTDAWQIDYDDNQELVEARLYQDKIYVVTRRSASNSMPCPIPLINGSSVLCTDIYHPLTSVMVDSVYTISKVNAQTGEIEDKNSFVGSSGLSVVYMSTEKIFITYTFNEDLLGFFYDFFKSDGRNLLTGEVFTKIENLNKLDISDNAKLTELSSILENYLTSKNSDEVLKFQNELQNKLNTYSQIHTRELETTGIVSIDLDKLDLESSSTVPGRPLNQFSLDYWDKHLRIATTIGQSQISQTESLNDVYVLDENLRKTGEVLGLGKGERIYSVRFIEDKGYVVTFKQIDPFYVIDLGSPSSPKVAGELKIPGYSSYLHPINKDSILGVGQDGQNVKISLFNVSDPVNPREESKYTLDEYWTEVNSNHHAFLMDEDNQTFFIPGGKGAYIISYKGGKLELIKAVSESGVQRAVYIDNFLYIITLDKVVVYDQGSWNQVSSLSL